MSRVFFVVALLVVIVFGFLLWSKQKKTKTPEVIAPAVITIQLGETSPSKPTPPLTTPPAPVPPPKEVKPPLAKEAQNPLPPTPLTSDAMLPKADRMEDIFSKHPSPLPFVSTVTYKSKVSWLKGRPAWISDYATHYKTSRHFIARSLHGKGNYYKEEISTGDQFNVLDPEKNIEFHLVLDLSRSRLWLYAYDSDSHQRYLLKDYLVGLGRPDSLKASGLLTPKGKYKLGDKIVAYKPGIFSTYNGKNTEMIRVFGSRWIPFEKEISQTTAPAKGFGIHGVPWVENPDTHALVEDASCLGTYTSDGCIRMASPDIEEVYALIVTKPSYIDIVSDVHLAKLPGEESN